MRNQVFFPAGVALFAVLLLAGAAHAATSSPPGFPPVFDPADFTDPTRIDNPYLPLTPCTSLDYQGVDAGQQLERSVSVGTSTGEVAGVQCRRVTVGLSIDGERANLTEECYAQDGAGNVWLLAQGPVFILYPLFPDPSPQPPPPVARWTAGVDGARPVLAMQAHPRLGRTFFQRDPLTGRQNATTVMSLTGSVHVPSGPWVGDVLVTWETASLNLGSPAYRYYGPGVGLLKSRTSGGEMELVSVHSCPVP